MKGDPARECELGLPLSGNALLIKVRTRRAHVYRRIPLLSSLIMLTTSCLENFPPLRVTCAGVGLRRKAPASRGHR